jgi:capsular polysaccharide transport system permease protein
MAKVTTERSSTIGVAGWAGARPGIWALLRKWLGVFNIWLWVFVFIPTLIAGVYYFAIASDLYMSEASFVVRSQSHPSVSGLGALLQTAGISRSEDDTFSVHDFVMSRDAVRDLENHDHLRDIFDRPSADLVTRFPNFLSGSSFEALYKHYTGFVSIGFDSTTGLSTLEVKAYRPDDAQHIALALLGYSEQLVNKLNARMNNDTLSLARSEVARAEARLVDVQDRLTAYRSQQQMLDPKLTSTGIYDTLKALMAARIVAQTQLTTLLKESPNSPQISTMRARLASLDSQLADARNQVTGDADSVAAKVGGYERLTLERELVEKELASATASLETARVDAQRQQLYIERIVDPNLADYPLYPKRFLSFFEVMGTCLLTYGIAWLLVAGVREHASA